MGSQKMIETGRLALPTDTMKPMTQHHELMSALADGQLRGEDFTQALTQCETDAEAVSRWQAYHLIGEVLRSPTLITPVSGAAFVSRLQARLGQEPSVGAVLPLNNTALLPADVSRPAGYSRPEAANDSSLRWKLVAGFASVAAVAAIAWNAGAGLLALPAAPQLARSEPAAPQVLVVSDQGTMVRDARMQELLAAHKQFGGISALQMPSGFLRNATFETPQGERR